MAGNVWPLKSREAKCALHARGGDGSFTQRRLNHVLEGEARPKEQRRDWEKREKENKLVMAFTLVVPMMRGRNH